MQDHWLERRLSELEKEESNFTFKFQGAVNWMRALAILCEPSQFRVKLKERYKTTTINADVNSDAQFYAFSHILMGVHFLAALQEMRLLKNEQNAAALIRSAIVSWYYGIYHSAKAMLVMQDGTVYETHKQIANAWDRQLCQNGLILDPFNYRVSSLVDIEAKKEISILGSAQSYANRLPKDSCSAVNCCCACLHGSVLWYREREKDRIANDRKFENFRTKIAQQARDERLSKCVCGFLHQAMRYRGKANYRDVLFLSYGKADSRHPLLIRDLETVLIAFISMAIAFCSKKINQENWSAFEGDVYENSCLGDYFKKLL